MSQAKKPLALLLAAAIILLAAGCAKQQPAPAPAAEPAPAEEQAAPVRSITEQALGLTDDTVVATVDGNAAPAELLTYQIGYACTYLDYNLQTYYGKGLDLTADLPSGENAADYIREESLAMLKQQLVLENLAARHGVALTDDERAELADQREADVAEYGEDGYLEELRKIGLTEAGYERVITAGYLYQSLAAAFADPNSPLYRPEDELAAFAAEQGYITADHILIPTIDLASGEPLSDGEIAENRALAENLLWQLRDASDPVALFKTLADEYSSDTGRVLNPDGYTFTEGAMVDEFDAAARALGEYEYSDVVESAYGYHIILRKPLDAAAAADAVRDAYFDRWFLDEVDAADMALTPAAEQFDVAAVYDAILDAQGVVGEEKNPFAPD